MALTIYTAPGCWVCGKVIRQLTHAGVPHQVIDLEQDQEAAAYVRDVLKAEAAPVVVDSENPGAWWCGPNPIAVAALIQAHQQA